MSIKEECLRVVLHGVCVEGIRMYFFIGSYYEIRNGHKEYTLDYMLFEGTKSISI
jgi:hypothetical protein